MSEVPLLMDLLPVLRALQVVLLVPPAPVVLMLLLMEELYRPQMLK